MRHLSPVVIILALGGPLLAQAPTASCCQMKVVSDEGSPAHLTITVTNVSQASVVVVRATPELDFRVRVTSNAGREADRVERGRRAPNDPIPLVSSSVMSRHLKASESFQENVDLSELFELKPGKYSVHLARTVYVEDRPLQLTAAIQIQMP